MFWCKCHCHITGVPYNCGGKRDENAFFSPFNNWVNESIWVVHLKPSTPVAWEIELYFFTFQTWTFFYIKVMLLLEWLSFLNQEWQKCDPWHTHTSLILPSHPFPREQTHYKCQVNAVTFLLHVRTGKKKKSNQDSIVGLHAYLHGFAIFFFQIMSQWHIAAMIRVCRTETGEMLLLFLWGFHLLQSCFWKSVTYI